MIIYIEAKNSLFSAITSNQPNLLVRFDSYSTSPLKTFRNGCAIAVKSEQEIWLIGGYGTEKRILSLNVNDHTFQVLPFQLNVGRWIHRCAFIPNTSKVMVTGGYFDGSLDSTEVLDIQDGSVTMASPMNCKRARHGIGVVTNQWKRHVSSRWWS